MAEGNEGQAGQGGVPAGTDPATANQGGVPAPDGSGGVAGAGGSGGGTPAGGSPQGGSPDQSAGGSPAPGTGSVADSIQDESLRTWAQSKGWQDVDALVKSTYNLERLVGAPADQIVRLPAKDDDGSGARQVLQRLGLPDSADKYELPSPENLPADQDFMTWAKGAFHEAGLTQQQATAVVSKFNEYSEQQVSSASEQENAKATAEDQQLHQDWGNGYERQVRMAKNAANQLGFDAEALDALEQTKGFASTMKLMADLGKKLGEDSFVNAETQRQGFSQQMTPAEARDAWNTMMADSEKQKALGDKSHPAHKDTLERKKALFEIMYPGG